MALGAGAGAAATAEAVAAAAAAAAGAAAAAASATNDSAFPRPPFPPSAACETLAASLSASSLPSCTRFDASESALDRAALTA